MGGGAIPYAYDAGDRLLSAGARGYQYDANGNVTLESLGDREATYGYNSENRVVSINTELGGLDRTEAWPGQGTSIRYSYDALGRRVERTQDLAGSRGSAQERYLYDGTSLDVVVEFRQRPRRGWAEEFSPELEYTLAGGGVLSSVSFDDSARGWGNRMNVSETSYYHTDILGSTIMLSDDHGHVRESYSYDAFGLAWDGSLTKENRLGYTGQRADPATGLYDYGYRDYSPRVGRWTTVDPIKAGANWYEYVDSDPVNLVDVWGLAPSDSQMTRDQMGAWNRSHEYNSESWLPGSQMTSDFLDPQARLRVSGGQYVTYLHTGIDRSGASDVVSAGYYEVLKVEDANRVVLARIGTDSRSRLVHLADTSNLKVGKILTPGEFIGTTALTDPSTGPHLHEEESVLRNGVRVFANPDTHEAAPPGTAFYWKRELLVTPADIARRQGINPYFVTKAYSSSLAPNH